MAERCHQTEPCPRPAVPLRTPTLCTSRARKASPALTAVCLLLLELDQRHFVPLVCCPTPPTHPHNPNLEGKPAPGETAKGGNCSRRRPGSASTLFPSKVLLGGWGGLCSCCSFLNQALGHLFTPCYALNCVP